MFRRSEIPAATGHGFKLSLSKPDNLKPLFICRAVCTAKLSGYGPEIRGQVFFDFFQDGLRHRAVIGFGHGTRDAGKGIAVTSQGYGIADEKGESLWS